jgi:hypothetical protein
VPNLKAIPTKIFGYSFRSRLEARWAVIFRNLGIRFSYEHEGYQLSGKYYLPDFYLNELDCYVEVKGKQPTNEEQMLAYLLSRDSEKYVHILSGSIPIAYPSMWYVDSFMIYSFNYKLMPKLEEKNTSLIRLYLGDVYMINQCPICGKSGFCKNSIIGNLSCRCTKTRSSELSKKVVSAFSSGRSASFEFKK